MSLLSEYDNPARADYNILVVSWAGWMFDFYDLIPFSFLLIPIDQELHFSNVGLSYVLGLLLAETSGGVAFGILSDRFDRKGVNALAINVNHSYYPCVNAPAGASMLEGVNYSTLMPKCID